MLFRMIRHTLLAAAVTAALAFAYQAYRSGAAPLEAGAIPAWEQPHGRP